MGSGWDDWNSTCKPVHTCIFGCVAMIWEGVGKIWEGVTKIWGVLQKSETCIALFSRALRNVPTLPVALNDQLAGDNITAEAWTWSWQRQGQGCARRCPGGQAARLQGAGGGAGGAGLGRVGPDGWDGEGKGRAMLDKVGI
jgi:hypothetical protein